MTATLGYDAADAVTSIDDAGPAGSMWSFGYGRDALEHLTTSSDPVEDRAIPMPTIA